MVENCTSLNIFIISLITFLIPVGVLAIGLLDIYANRNSGLSRSLYSAFLFTILSFFLFNLLTEVEMGSIQIFGFVLLLPFSMIAGPLMLMYQETLMGHSHKLLGKTKIFWHFVPAIYSLVILLAGLFMFSIDELNDILTIQHLESTDRIERISRGVLVSAHILWYIQLFWYIKKIRSIYVHQQRKYGKFYASYEERNEQLMLRQMIILFFVAFYDLMFWVVRVRNPYLLIAANIFFGVVLTYLVIAGREQINIKRYRMYKLNSHEHELDEANIRKHKTRKTKLEKQKNRT